MRIAFDIRDMRWEEAKKMIERAMEVKDQYPDFDIDIYVNTGKSPWFKEEN